MPEESQHGKMKWVIIAIGAITLIVLSLWLVARFAPESSVGKQIGEALPFGALGAESPRSGFAGNTDNEDTGFFGGVFNETTGDEPLFRQLTEREIAGATTYTRDGKTYVRYVLRENGFIYDIDTTTWETTEISNTFLPRVYEAVFGANGNAVVLRYLKLDPLTRRDVIKSFLADITPPETGGDGVGKLRGRDLLDNISAVSISPDGALLFFLLPIDGGVSGSVVYLTSDDEPREVLRNSFSEWLPQILNNGKIVLTTKPSAQIPGFSYLYDPSTQTLTRLVREKNGLTTLGNGAGDRILFNNNIGGNVTLNLYASAGFSSEEGFKIYETSIPVTTLPEKCAWGVEHPKMFYCGTFQESSKNIPDDWYQGSLFLKDTMWMVDAETAEITLLADPEKEVQRYFDVFQPFMGNGDRHFYFVDKQTGFLWVMRIDRPEGSTPALPTEVVPPPPEESADAAGSMIN
jgi:hypothetical protein